MHSDKNQIKVESPFQRDAHYLSLYIGAEKMLCWDSFCSGKWIQPTPKKLFHDTIWRGPGAFLQSSDQYLFQSALQHYILPMTVVYTGLKWYTPSAQTGCHICGYCIEKYFKTWKVGWMWACTLREDTSRGQLCQGVKVRLACLGGQPAATSREKECRGTKKGKWETSEMTSHWGRSTAEVYFFSINDKENKVKLVPNNEFNVCTAPQVSQRTYSSPLSIVAGTKGSIRQVCHSG